jgi:DNA mismatch repair protein MutL
LTIRILDEDVANKIAAGEVIERPASVVKELIENAIDANGRRLLVEIRDAGMTYIRVSDDGEGIEAKQLPLAFLRHATSKITAASDLRSVRTLGFRGEALASIAAVARVEIYSRPQEQPTGAYLRIEGGQVLTHESAGCPVGTNIIVKDLFYNTPARRKFLKSPGAEKRYIIDVVGRLALANPHVAIRLVCDKEEVLSTQGNGDMLLAIQAVFGGELASGMLPIQGQLPPGTINGYIGLPELARGQRTHQVFIINGRCIESRLLTSALERSYGSLLMTRRFPVAVVQLQLDPAFIDVNVHPAKSEVRFQDDSMVYRGLLLAGQRALGQREADRTWPMSPEPKGEQAQWTFEPAVVGRVEPLRELQSPYVTTAPQPTQVIGQVFQGFIIVQTPTEMLIIDQHAAHERILYERLRRQQEDAAIQELLLPVTLDAGPEQAHLIESNRELLHSLGVGLEGFGGTSFILRHVPTFLASKGNWSELLSQITEALAGTSPEDALLVTLACHGAVKYGDRLTLHEMETLVADLFQADCFGTCPHGRPTILRYSQGELERRFGR